MLCGAVADPELKFRPPQDERPTGEGMAAITIAAVGATLGGLILIGTSWSSDNIVGSLVVAVLVIAVAGWIDWRAWLTWTRYAERRPPADDHR
jgi:hypothetical protein